MSLRCLFLVAIAFGLPALTFAAPPATPSAREFTTEPPRAETLQALYDAPEITLLADEQVKEYRDKENQTVLKLPLEQRSAVRQSCNQTIHRAFLAAAFREGLPLKTKGSLLAGPDAAVMQTLSKGLRDLGFISVPAATKFTRTSPESGKTRTSADQAKALNQWCAANRLEKFPGAPATLMQMLQAEDVPVRLALVEQLAKVKSSRAGAMLANRALMDLSSDVRRTALLALKKRQEKEYLPTILKGLRYPWPPVADHAADALAELKPKGVDAALCDLLDMSDPRAPFTDPKSKRMVVAELACLNHLRNCLCCHAPSMDEKDGLVRGLMPILGKPLRQAYYEGSDGSDHFIRADITFLRQDFSANLKVENAKPWPDVQRFDFVVRLRPATAEEIAKAKTTDGEYPHTGSR